MIQRLLEAGQNKKEAIGEVFNLINITTHDIHVVLILYEFFFFFF